MRFMIIVQSTKDSEAGVLPNDKFLAKWSDVMINEELANAGA